MGTASRSDARLRSLGLVAGLAAAAAAAATKCIRELFEVVAVRKCGVVAQTVLACSNPLRQICRCPQPIPQRKLCGKIDAAFGRAQIVMPAMEFRSIEHVQQLSHPDANVTVVEHSPHCVKDSLEQGNLRRGAQQKDGCELHRLGDEDFQRVRARTCKPIHMQRRVRRLVRPPQHAVAMLQPMKPVLPQIVCDEKEKKLCPEREAADKMQS